jgi:hypothetical protein
MGITGAVPMGARNSRTEDVAMTKKAAFFTIVSLVIVVFLIFIYTTSHKSSLIDKSDVIRGRVLSMDSFIEDVEHDVERGLYISAMRSLIGMSEYMTENGTFFTDFVASFNEIMLNGTIDNNIINITKNASFGDWIRKIEDLGRKLDIDVSIDNMTVSPYHKDPWNVNVNVIGIMNLTDMKGLASWTRAMNVTATISIDNFEDPLYTVTSAGKFANKIEKTNVTGFSDTDDLILHANNSWYIESSKAPNFLMRFSNNLSSSAYGIESIVNVDDLQLAVPELYRSGASCVDYIYFGNYSISNCRVNETKDIISWFRLDDADSYHLNLYEAECE